mmetsp:Transcript_4492/g.10576  ORF Transcript_4492/g.10576 Transcript_4492/m.10576 type:complete len:262 (-) Transcript_4492:458-1243(-)
MGQTPAHLAGNGFEVIESSRRSSTGSLLTVDDTPCSKVCVPLLCSRKQAPPVASSLKAPECSAAHPCNKDSCKRCAVYRAPRPAVSQPQRQSVPVILHVYDISSFSVANTSIPIVHLGVEIFGTEFSFGDMGVSRFKPGSYDSTKHKEAIMLGHTKLHRWKVHRLITRLKKEWPGTCYRLVGCNCQTFAEKLCAQLGLEGSIPSQYLYFAKPWTLVGGLEVADLVPMALSARVGSNSSGSSSSGSGSGSGSGSCRVRGRSV